MKDRFWTRVMEIGDWCIINWYEMVHRVKTWWIEKKVRRMKLSYKGQYALKYYESIVEGKENGRIEAYEEALEDMIGGMRERGFEIERREAAESMVEMMKMMGECE